MPIKERLKKILDLFLCFLKIGAFTFGGGYAMVSLVQRDMVEKKKWLTEREMVDVIAIAESTPGVIALNTATYVGAKIAGFWGSLFASIGAMLPSVIIILAIYPVIQLFGENQYVKWAFLGIRACVSALILNATYKISKMNEKTVVSFVVTGVALVLALLSTFEVIKLDMIFIILGAALFGIIWGIIGRQRKKKKGTAESAEQSVVGESAAENLSETGEARKPDGEEGEKAAACNEPDSESVDNTDASAPSETRGDAESAAKESDGKDDDEPVSERADEKKEEN